MLNGTINNNQREALRNDPQHKRRTNIMGQNTAKDGKKLVAGWIAQIALNANTALVVHNRTIATLDYLHSNDLSRDQLKADQFIKAAGKAWPTYAEKTGKHEKGEARGVTFATSEEGGEVPEAFAWEACRKQLAKYAFDSDGKVLKKGDVYLPRIAPTPVDNPKRSLAEQSVAAQTAIDKIKARDDFEDSVEILQEVFKAMGLSVDLTLTIEEEEETELQTALRELKELKASLAA